MGTTNHRGIRGDAGSFPGSHRARTEAQSQTEQASKPESSHLSHGSTLDKPSPVSTNLSRLIVEAGKASPSPPVGPALGSRGIKAMDFCKLFNAQTSHIEPTIPIRVNMTINGKDKSYNAASDSKAHSFIGSELSLKFIYHLALIKKSVDHEDLEHIPLESVARSIAAQVRNMGIKLVP
ncbi:hypothetical protein PtB15_13B508 [Puccinia triticina]|nr:hypothetical protein PtB15_13B508 [Puccinia triticina]